MGIIGMVSGMMVRLAYNQGKDFFEIAHNKMEQVGEVISGRLLATGIMKRSKKYHLLVKVRMETENKLMNIFKGIFMDKYQIVDGEGEIQYKGKYKYLSDKKFNTDPMLIEVYDIRNEKIGYIKKRIYKDNEKNIKICSIYRENEKILDIKSPAKSNEILLETEQTKFKINYNKLNAYDFKYQNKQIAKLNITRTKKENGYMEKYVLEYEDKEDEVSLILLSMAINLICCEKMEEKRRNKR